MDQHRLCGRWHENDYSAGCISEITPPSGYPELTSLAFLAAIHMLSAGGKLPREVYFTELPDISDEGTPSAGDFGAF